MESIVEQAAEEGVEEVIIGMAHRGRLNVLTNLMGKTYDEIFSEFEGFEPEKTFGDGDVKYHLGFSSLFTTKSGKKVNLKLSPNPSHLEAVDPVVEGFARAKADTVYNSDYDKILPILIHGDAAVAGQGVVYEVLQMSKLDGYYTGGTIHYVINNQIGFTTDFDDARSSDYCTSIARTVDAPIIQVNGDDIEAVVFASELALSIDSSLIRTSLLIWSATESMATMSPMIQNIPSLISISALPSMQTQEISTPKSFKNEAKSKLKLHANSIKNFGMIFKRDLIKSKKTKSSMPNRK